jgi:4-hydroxythreonine-4-phosphate dehydrogenase
MPTIYITMGDPRGIGPEVALKALAEDRGPERIRLVGVLDVFARAARTLGLEELFARLEPDAIDVSQEGGGRVSAEVLPVDGTDDGLTAEAPRMPPAVAGRWAGLAIAAAVRDLRPEEVDVLVTGPLDKAALVAGGYPFPGHTEMLAALAGVREVAMMLVAGELRVSLVTGHIPLREVPRRLDERRIREVFRLTHDALRAGFGVEQPRLAVCGLNPHAGDGGTLGEEDERLVAPVVRGLREEGFEVTGPVPADTVFVRAIAGEFDAVLALYHDQGMIPIKVHGFGRGVNVTLGLPFVRTSPDHGTALDIAGRGVARPASFAAALALARDLGGRPGFVRTPVVKAARVQ